MLVSETVRSLARASASVRFEDRGEQSLKGISEPVRVWVVVSSFGGQALQRRDASAYPLASSAPVRSSSNDALS